MASKEDRAKAKRRKAPAKPEPPAEEPQEVVVSERPVQPVATERPTPFGARKIVLPADGTLLRMDGAPAVFVMRDGQRRPFANAEAFTACGFGWNDIVVLPPKEIVPIPVGPEVVRASDL